jgi:hypothetical protein
MSARLMLPALVVAGVEDFFGRPLLFFATG